MKTTEELKAELDKANTNYKYGDGDVEEIIKITTILIYHTDNHLDEIKQFITSVASIPDAIVAGYAQSSLSALRNDAKQLLNNINIQKNTVVVKE